MLQTSNPASSNSPSTLTLTAVETTARFIDSVGVNMHSGMANADLPYAYRDPQLVEKALQYLDVTHIRDGLGAGFSKTGYDYTTVTESYLAARGYKFDFPISTLAAYETEALKKFSTLFPGALQSVEGPNEANSWGIDTVKAFQQSLYDFVHSDPSLNGVDVMDFTLAYATTTYFTKYGDLSSMSDEGNVHIYSTGGRSPSAFGQWLSVAQAATPTQQMNVTETGYTTLTSNTSYGVDQATQSKYILNTLMDAAENHVATTYLYELLDRTVMNTASPMQGYFGLFAADGTPKQSATAVHNLMTILDTGSKSASGLGTLDVVFNQPLDKSVHKIVIQKSSNTFDLVLWAEPNIWDSSKQQAIQASKISVDLSFLSAKAAALYDPTLGTAALHVFDNPGASSLIEVSDHPVIIEVTLNDTTAVPAVDAAEASASTDAAAVLPAVVSSIPTYSNGVLTKLLTSYAPGGAELSNTKMFNTSGALISEMRVHADLTKDVYLSAVAGKTYVAEHDIYDAAGNKIEVTRTHADGTLDYHYVLHAEGTKTTDSYDATGKQKSHVEIRTDGYTDTLTYKDGVPSSQMIKYAPGGTELTETKLYAMIGDASIVTRDTQVHADGSKDVYISHLTGRAYTDEHDTYTSAGIMTGQIRTFAGRELQTFNLDAAGTKTTDAYDATGLKTLHTEIQTNGYSDIQTYNGGVLASEAIKYAPGSAELSESKLYANVGGAAVMTSDTQIHADGSKDVYLFEIGGKTYTDEHDTYTAAGVMTHQTRTFAGHELQTFNFDDNGTKTTDIYDAAGVKTLHTEVRTNGYSETLTYKDGVLVSEAVKYGPGGVELSETKAYINVGGQAVLTNDTLVHASGAKDVYATPATLATSYQTKHTTYDASGKLVSTDQTNLDGSHVQTASQTGVTLASTAGVDDMFKSVGGDTFTFTAGFGHDTVTGFQAGGGSSHDLLILDQSYVHDFADLQAHMSASGKDSLLDFGGGDTILLKNVLPGALTPENVQFLDHGFFQA